jgi:hypothetical protein
VVAVEVEDRPGGLNKILEILRGADLNVEYMYAYVRHRGRDAVMVFRFDHIDTAIDVLKTNGVSIIEKEQLDRL